MKLTVLGKYGPFPAPCGACSGYLLECGGTNLILDLGSGTLSRLLKFLPELDIAAVLLTHLHSDHMADMLVLRYALTDLAEHGHAVPFPLTVIAPDTPEDVYRTLAGSGVYDIHAASDGLRLRLDGITLTLHRTVHPVQSYAYCIEHDGHKLFYTGDTGTYKELVDKCSGADLLLCDACFLSGENTKPIPAHITAADAGRLAREAGVRRLILTHVWGLHTAADERAMLNEARVYFPDTEVAEEMRSYLI